MSIVDRFWSKVSKSDGCWIWIASLDRKGYGQINAGGRHGKPLRAHRVSYEINVGPIPAGLDVLLTCDVRACVKPAHLYLGTDIENSADKVTRSRQSRWEARWSAKLDGEKIELLRWLADKGASQTQVAWCLGVTQSVVSRVLSGDAWRGRCL